MPDLNYYQRMSQIKTALEHTKNVVEVAIRERDPQARIAMADYITAKTDHIARLLVDINAQIDQEGETAEGMVTIQGDLQFGTIIGGATAVQPTFPPNWGVIQQPEHVLEEDLPDPDDMFDENSEPF